MKELFPLERVSWKQWLLRLLLLLVLVAIAAICVMTAEPNAVHLQHLRGA